MNSVTAELTIDVTAIAPRQKHATIFQAWTNLEEGGAMLLRNDHDPLPLYYQFACEYAGRFRWEYVERGPEWWRVRIAKGDYPDPGFVPGAVGTPRTPVEAARAPGPLVLDTRPIFEAGDTPCQAIDEAIASLEPGQALVLLVPFEPVPLYAKLRKEGFAHQSAQQEDGAWRVEFRRA
jgi:uncharacterized protein (DUF2249 family)